MLVGRVTPCAPIDASQDGAHGVTRPTNQASCAIIYGGVYRALPRRTERLESRSHRQAGKPALRGALDSSRSPGLADEVAQQDYFRKVVHLVAVFPVRPDILDADKAAVAGLLHRTNHARV